MLAIELYLWISTQDRAGPLFQKLTGYWKEQPGNVSRMLCLNVTTASFSKVLLPVVSVFHVTNQENLRFLSCKED